MVGRMAPVEGSLEIKELTLRDWKSQTQSG